MYFNIEKKFDLDIGNIHDPIVLIGWPGIGLVGKLTITSVKDSLQSELFLNIECFDFPSKCVIEKGMLEIPAAQVFYKSRKPNNDLFILTANFQPQTSVGIFEFSKVFCEEMDKITGKKIKMYVSTGALVTEQLKETRSVHICGTNMDLIQSFLDLEDTEMMDGGVIAGANGILPAWAGSKGFAHGICLLAETTPFPLMTVDPLASKALVKLLKDYFKIDIDFDDLDKKIEDMEKFMDSYKERAEHFMRPPDDDGPDSYFR